MRKLFGTDGIRGRANAEPLTPELTLRFGQAVAGTLARPELTRPRIVVGRDTRRSGDLLEGALIAGICSSGFDVLLVGVLPTPAVALLTRELNASAGIVISASHNSFEDNGLKVFGGDGFKLADAQEEAIETAIANDSQAPRPVGSNVGVVQRVHDAPERYVAHVLKATQGTKSLAGCRVVLDCANGAAYEVAPRALRALGATVVTLAVEPDGDNINAKCGAMHPDLLRERVVAEDARLGIALDGDADRVVLVDEHGEVVDGDEVLAIIARDLHAHGGLKGVVGTVMSNMGLELALQQLGVTLQRAAVGDRYVVEELRKKGLLLGGEPSGHIVFLRYATTGDGLLAALLVAGLMASSGVPLSELRKAMQRLPQKLINVRVRERRDLESIASVRKKLQHVTQALAGRGRILVRYSGTEPLVRVMVEGDDASQVESYAREIAAVISSELGGD